MTKPDKHVFICTQGRPARASLRLLFRKGRD